jgi:hypothetical protein
MNTSCKDPLCQRPFLTAYLGHSARRAALVLIRDRLDAAR